LPPGAPVGQNGRDMATDPQAGRPKQPAKAKAKPPPAEPSHPHRPYWAALMLTVLGWLVMQGLERTVFEWTGLVRKFEEWAVVLPAVLRLPQPGSDARVVVIDIDEFEAETVQGAPRPLKLTPRSQLLGLVETCLENGAQGVAVDIDFGEGDGFLPNGPRTQEEFDAKSANDTFVMRVRRLQQQLDREGSGRRIVLGVKRSEAKGPAGWLGSPIFAGLAATIGVPQDSPARLPKWVRPEDSGRDAALPSLSAALAEAATVERDLDFGPILEPHVERPIEGQMRGDSRFTVAEYFFDPLEVPRIEAGKVTVASPTAGEGFGLADEDLARLSGALVVIGDVSSPLEGITRVPGLGRDVPGTLIHAAGAATLATRPYRSVRAGLAPVFDLAFAFLAVSLAYGLKTLYARRVRLDPELLNKAVSRLFVGLCLVTGFALVWGLRIVWEGFLWAALTLPVGNFIESRIPAFGKWLDRVIIRAGGGEPA
jgi:hypothetical protein